MLKSILSILFIFLLSLPNLISLEHFFDDNHHQVCVEGKVHFHEKESVCISCDFIRYLQDVKLYNNHFSFCTSRYCRINRTKKHFGNVSRYESKLIKKYNIKRTTSDST